MQRLPVVLGLLSGGCAAIAPAASTEATPGPAAPAASCSASASASAVASSSPSASASAAASVAPPPLKQRDAVSLRVGERALEIAFEAGPNGFVSSITDGETALAVPPLKGKDAQGRGRNLVLLDHVERSGRAYALFAATTHGSPECGSYGFWALRLDMKGVRMTPMIEGCFLSVGDGHPTIVWSAPALLVLQNPQYTNGARVEVFTLDEAAMVFRSRIRANPAE